MVRRKRNIEYLTGDLAHHPSAQKQDVLTTKVRYTGLLKVRIRVDQNSLRNFYSLVSLYK